MISLRDLAVSTLTGWLHQVAGEERGRRGVRALLHTPELQRFLDGLSPDRPELTSFRVTLLGSSHLVWEGGQRTFNVELNQFLEQLPAEVLPIPQAAWIDLAVPVMKCLAGGRPHDTPAAASPQADPQKPPAG